MTRSLPAIVAIVLVLAGCGEPSRPPVSESSTTSVTPVSTASDVDTDDGPCEPGAERECRMHYVDDEGRAQCPLNTQTCGDEGRWQPCGAHAEDRD